MSQPPKNKNIHHTLTAIEQFERDRIAFAIVAKETGMFDFIVKLANTFGRIPSASITTNDGVTTSYKTPQNITMPKLHSTKQPDIIPNEKPAPTKKTISNNYSRSKMTRFK